MKFFKEVRIYTCLRLSNQATYIKIHCLEAIEKISVMQIFFISNQIRQILIAANFCF